MKLHIVVTDSAGNVFEGDLRPVAEPRTARAFRKRAKPVAVTTPSASNGKLDLSLPVRAFVNRYAKSLSGPRKCALLAGRLADGKVGATVEVSEFEKYWNTMIQLMNGPYQTIFLTRAKNEGWLDTPERGKIVVLKDWNNAAR